jgi:hypothetical protein
LADTHLAVIGKGHDRRRRAIALTVLDDAGLVAFHYGNTGVRRAEVNSDNLAHFL